MSACSSSLIPVRPAERRTTEAGIEHGRAALRGLLAHGQTSALVEAALPRITRAYHAGDAVRLRQLLGRALGAAMVFALALPALLFPGAMVITVHGREVGRPRGLAFLLLSLTLRRARRIVAVSDATRALLIDRLPALDDRTITAWNGVVMPPERPPTPFARREGHAQVLSVCRLVARKNMAAAVRAAAPAAVEARVAAAAAAAPRSATTAARRATSPPSARIRVSRAA